MTTVVILQCNVKILCCSSLDIIAQIHSQPWAMLDYLWEDKPSL